MTEHIEKVFNEDIRPYLRNHGGDVEIISIENGIVKIRMLGQCSGCPSASLTIEEVIKNTLREKGCKIKEIVVENQISQDMLDLAHKLLHRND